MSVEKPVDSVGGCVCIPVYNHGKTVAEVVRGALEYASCVLVCDDGSTDGSGDNAKAAGAEVLTLERNSGKGVALATLFAQAHRRGFRYALCLDADGQHLPSDLPAFVAEVRSHPGALVVGARDLAKAGAPGKSQFGRKFSNFWTWFESGQRVEDSQSGFRAYPVDDVVRLGVRGKRYDYEVEILVRAGWAGVPLRSLPIGVIYPKDRITHFDNFRDNVRISLLNTRTCGLLLLPMPLGPQLHPLPHRPGLSLFALRRWAWLGLSGPLARLFGVTLGMSAVLAGGAWGLLLAALAAVAGLGALPVLSTAIAARLLASRGVPLLNTWGALASVAVAVGIFEWVRSARASGRWTGKSRGGVIGHWIFYQVTRVFGVASAYLLLYPVVLYFTLTAPLQRSASMLYLDRLLGPARGLRRWRRTYRHIFEFARTILDGAVLGTHGPAAFQCVHEGLEHMQRAAREGKGAVLLTAHLGNWEVASGLLEGKLDAPLALVAYRAEEQRMQQALERFKGKRPRIISVGAGELGSLDILHALREGTLVAMQGDRTVDEHDARVPFLGVPARWPVGPFVLAAISGAPLVSTFALQTGPVSYHFVADPPRTYRFDRSRPRDAQLAEWVGEYVRRLETLVREHPYQWFNFYDFWSAEPPTQPARKAA